MLDRQSGATGEWREEAMRLRDEGLSIRAIARQVGKARATVGEFFKPGVRVCQCGGQRHRQSVRCRECIMATVAVRESLVEGMWAAGWIRSEIRDALGWSENSDPTVMIDRLRRQGRAPYRYSTERIAAAVEGQRKAAA